MKPMAPMNLLQGQAGVWRVAAELALRGFNPHFPGVDYGYDIVIDGGIRIQVKCTHLVSRVNQPYAATGGAYFFKLSKGPVVTGNNTIKKRGAQQFSKFNEFVILHGITENRYWIVPAAELDGHQAVAVGPGVSYKSLDATEIRRMHDSGMTQQQIAETLGVNQMTISRRLSGQFVETKRPLCLTVRGYEARWDLIEQYVETLQEAESVVTQAEPVT